MTNSLSIHPSPSRAAAVISEQTHHLAEASEMLFQEHTSGNYLYTLNELLTAYLLTQNPEKLRQEVVLSQFQELSVFISEAETAIAQIKIFKYN